MIEEAFCHNPRALTRTVAGSSLKESMEPSIEIFVPLRLYGRVGWAALAGSAISVLCGLREHWAYVPGGLCAATALILLWLSLRPAIRIGHTQFSVGERAIAWREVREINSSRLISPLVLHLKLTNSRHRTLVFPGEPERIAKLLFYLRLHSTLASFDGVAYRDYWTWNNVKEQTGDTRESAPVRMLSRSDEDEIERMFKKLKSAGRLDSKSKDSSKTPHED